ncbi:hypothetical protein AKJ16_DCAP24034 [Drosera capensis]
MVLGSGSNVLITDSGYENLIFYPPQLQASTLNLNVLRLNRCTPSYNAIYLSTADAWWIRYCKDN